MKNKKLLVLLPAVALMLAGCGNPSDDDHSGSDTSTSDTSGSTTGSTTNTGSTGSTGTTDTSGGQSLPDGVTEADFGTADAPITLAQAKTLIDKLIPAAPTTAKETKSFLGLPIFLKAKSTGNDAKGQYDIFRTWLQTDELKFTVMNALPADGVTGGDTANGFAGKILTVKGYGALYLTDGGQLQYEIVKKDNDDKPSILKAEDSGEHHAEPAPQNKTFAELYAMSITSGDDVKDQLYVSRGKIKAFKTGSTKDQYGNMTLIDPTDASKEIVVYGASASNWLVWQDAVGAYSTVNPKDFMTNAATKDLAVGDIIDFTGVCYTHSGVKNLSIKVTGKYVPTPESVVFSEDAYNLTVGQDLDLSTLVTLTPSGSGTLNYEIVGGTSEYATLTNSSLHGDAAGDVTVKVSVAGTELNDTAVVHVNPLVPESVHFDEDELNLYVGEELDLRSHAVLNPADSGELSYSITAGDSFATLDGYTLTGTADGDVTVKVEVVDYPALYDTITVHVSTAADGVITDIQSTGSSKTMYIDGTDDEKTVTFEVTVTSNGTRTEGVVWEITSGSEFVTISYEDFPGDDTHCVVTLKNDVTTTGFVEIVAKAADHPTDYHVEHDVTIDQHVAPSPYGTEDDPLTPAEAQALLESEVTTVGAFTAEQLWVEGVVSDAGTQKSYGWQNVYLGADTASKTLLAYSVNKGDGMSADLYKGDTILLHGYGKKQSNTVWELASNGSTYVHAISLTRGTSEIALTANDEQVVVNGLPANAENGTNVSFTVAANAGYQVIEVTANGVKLVESAGSYSFTVAGDTSIVVTSDEEGAAVAQELSFAIAGSSFPSATRTDTQGVYTSGIATVTLDKAASTTNNRYSDSDHLRIYTGASLTIAISSGTIQKIVITATSDSYASALNSSTWTNATSGVSGSTVTATASSDSITSISFSPSAQVRINNIVIYYFA